jgi:hypothetical protein
VANASNQFTTPCTGYVSGVEQFFKDMAADSGKATNSDSVSTQYNDAVGGTHWSGGPAPGDYKTTYGGEIVDTDAYPPSGCPGAPTGGVCLTDAQIQAELQKVLSAGNYPAGFTNEYFLLTPPDVASCFAQNPDGSWDCSGNAGGTGRPVFCAYHSQTATSGRYLYANVPDMDELFGCDPFSSPSPSGNSPDDCSFELCVYNQGWAEGVLSAVSHEHNESVTDPEPNNAWTDWGSNVGGENGDKCNGDGLDDPNLVPDRSNGNDGSFTVTPYNEKINGDFYLIQEEWSNDGTRCLDHWSPSTGIPGASFIVSAQSGRTVTFNAAGSCGNASAITACSLSEYVWQFNDNTAPGQPPQNGTIETSSPTITHTFPKPGTYLVALTTQTPVGFSHGTEAIVHVTTPPSPHISASGSGLAGTAVHFSSAGTTHDPAVSIAHYSWHFGDGATSTAANPSHVYQHAGTFAVTLTVTDTKGGTGLVGGSLTISPSCRVPNVKGKSLPAAKTALRAAHCAVGKIKKPTTKRKRPLVVKSQSPGAGAIKRVGFHVALTLRYK